MTKLLFLEDHISVREGVSIALEKMDPSLKIFQAGTMDDALHILSDNPEITTAIIDLSLSDALPKDMPDGGGVVNCPRKVGHKKESPWGSAAKW